MQGFISNMQDSIELFRNTGKIILLITSMLGFFLVKTNHKSRVIICYIIFGCIILLTPFFRKESVSLMGGDNMYRLGMILIIPIVSSYALTLIFLGIKDRKSKRIAIIGIIVLLAASGRFVYTNEFFFQFNNEEKVYDLAVNLSDCVTTTNNEPTVAISEVQGVFIRQYNPKIRLICAPYKTENWDEVEDVNIMNMRVLLSESEPDMSSLSNLSKQLGCDYLILLNQQVKEDNPQNYGFSYINTFGDFQVFENIQE